MITRREFLEYLINLVALYSIPNYVEGGLTDVDNLLKSINILMKNDTMSAAKTLLADFCYDAGSGIKCQFEYFNEKRGKNFINSFLPSLKNIVENKKRYEASVLVNDKKIGIKTYGEGTVELMLPKINYTNEENKDILHLEGIVKDLFYNSPKTIYKEGADVDINCVKGSNNFVKCIFSYESVGKKTTFINKYTPKINQLKNDAAIFVEIPEKYREIETKAEGSYVILKAEDR